MTEHGSCLLYTSDGNLKKITGKVVDTNGEPLIGVTTVSYTHLPTVNQEQAVVFVTGNLAQSFGYLLLELVDDGV